MRIICSLVFSLVFTCGVQAQFRKYSNEFLNIGAGARALGMGGANIASVSGSTAGYWNPARLATVQDNPNISLLTKMAIWTYVVDTARVFEKKRYMRKEEK